MKKKFALLFGLIFSITIALGNPFNSWQAFQPFKNRFLASLGGGGYPQSGSIIINTPFDNSLISLVGPNPTFTRSLLRNYSSSKTQISEVATTVPAFGATVFGATNSIASGIDVNGERENLILQSEDFSTTWTTIGTGTVTANTEDSPVAGVDTLADTIAGSATNDGVSQDSGLSSTNAGYPFHTSAWLFSVYLKTSSGTGLIDLNITDSAGTTQQATTKCRIDTTWRRCEVYQQFTSTVSGTVVVKIVVGNTSNTRAFGAMLQRAGSTGYGTLRARRNAGPYVKTTTTTMFANQDQLTYPSATIDLARTAGSLSMMVKPEMDGSSKNSGAIISYFSTGSEQFSFYDSNSSLALWIANSPFSPTLGMTLRKGEWNHLLITWNDTTNRKKIFINGIKIYDDSSAFTAWTAGNDLFLGNHSAMPSYWSSNSNFRNFVMWNTDLSDAEAISVYKLENGIFEETYATGLLFDVDLGVSAAPITANDYRYTYIGSFVEDNITGTGQASLPTFSNSTTYGSFAGHNKIPLPSYVPGGTGLNPGMVFEPVNRNIMLQSTAPATTWTAVGAPTITNAVGNMYGANMPFGTIAGVSGEGIRQSNASYPVADKGFVASAYVSTASGTCDGQIHIEGSSGGTPETTTQAFTASTTIQRVYIYKLFSGAATGNAQMRINLTATCTLRVSGMQVEERNILNHLAGKNEFPNIFIRTTTAEVRTWANYLFYNSAGNFNVKNGTAIIWATLDGPSSGIQNSDGPNLISLAGDACSFDLHFVSDNINFCIGGDVGNVVTKASPGFTANQWNQYGIMWACGADADNDGDAPCDLALWLNGIEEDTGSFSDVKIPGAPSIVIGAGLPSQLATDHHKGLIGKIKIYGGANSSYITSDWASNRAGYGR